MTSDPSTVELRDAWQDFVSALSLNEGVSKDRFERLRTALESCASSWNGRSEIPRVAANILVDIFSAIDSLADSYTGDSQDQIRDMGYELQDLVHECVAMTEHEIEDY